MSACAWDWRCKSQHILVRAVKADGDVCVSVAWDGSTCVQTEAAEGAGKTLPH